MADDDRPSERPRHETSTTRRSREQTQRDFELEFFARILERDPLHIAVLRAHAHNLARAEHYGRALQLDRRLAGPFRV